jgi:uncharacterized protein (DUF305 family)
MKTRILLVLGTVGALSATGAVGQQNQPQQPAAGGHMQMSMSGESLPEECRTAAQAGGQAQMTQTMQGMDMQGMSQHMQGMMANMNDAQKGYMQAMMKMHGPMMTGVMAKDADVAFVCGMIAHHQGAIDMAQVVLKTGDNVEAKRMAEKTIKEQGQEVTEMKDWLKKNARKEGNQ